MKTQNPISSRRAFTIFLTSLLIGLSGLLIVGSASATLIDLGNSTLDDATNLEWLDLTETLGLSYNQAEASSFVTTDGYRHATYLEVKSLFLNAGFLTTDNTNTPANDPAAALLLDLMGVTQFENTNFDTGRGFADYSETQTVRPNYHEGPLGAGAAVVSLFQADKNFVDATAGHYLVRVAQGQIPVPEPATIVLLGFGLVGMSIYKLRKRSAR